MSRRRLFGSLSGLVFLVNLGRIVFAPLLATLAAAFAVPVATLGPVATMAWLGSALPRVPTGYLLTRVPRHRVVLGSGLLLTAAAVLIHGIFPSVDRYLLATLPDRHRASAYAAYSGTMMIVQATGSTAVGGLASVGVGYDAIFAGFAPGLVGVFLVLLGSYAAGRLPAESE